MKDEALKLALEALDQGEEYMKDEALKLALEALDNLLYWDNGKPEYDEAREAITAINQALASPVQEPVAYPEGDVVGPCICGSWPGGKCLKCPRIAPPAAQPARSLQDIEQYRMQMAGISTASIGYWKDGDSVHPDYDTVALRDVAELYEKYAALYKAREVNTSAAIAGALLDFVGWLTTRPKRIMFSSVDDAAPAVEAITEFAKMRGLSLDDAKVQDWQDNTTPPAAPVQQPLTPEQREEIYAKSDLAMRANKDLRWRDAIVNYVEAAHGITKGQP
jgi:hypothetical protein